LKKSALHDFSSKKVENLKKVASRNTAPVVDAVSKTFKYLRGVLIAGGDKEKGNFLFI
jgi:hypothetical protein